VVSAPIPPLASALLQRIAAGRPSFRQAAVGSTGRRRIKLKTVVRLPRMPRIAVVSTVASAPKGAEKELAAPDTLEKNVDKIAVLGLWHQGIVGAACLSKLGYSITAADSKVENIERLRSGESPIYEPGLDDLISEGLAAGNLAFTSNPVEAVRDADAIFIMFDTPVDDDDNVVVDEIFDTVQEISGAIKDGAKVHITSQVPVGTCRKIIELLERAPASDVGVSYSPENLALGKAIETFFNPRLPMIGADSRDTYDAIAAVFRSFHPDWDFVGIETAEMSKHALNSYLATSVCFGNELGRICDEVGADGHTIAMALRSEPRVGPKAMILPGLAFSGGTLARDVQTLRRIAAGCDLAVPMLDSIIVSNAKHNAIILRKLNNHFGRIDALKVLVLGLTYKPDTSTLRRSAAVDIVNDLVGAGAVVACSDPKADQSEVAARFQDNASVAFSRDPFEAAEGASAVVLMTPWGDYGSLDFGRLGALMTDDRLVIDPFEMWDRTALEGAGYAYRTIGKGYK